jgi:hypothetical protein
LHFQKAEARYIANIKVMAAVREKEQDRLYERCVSIWFYVFLSLFTHGQSHYYVHISPLHLCIRTPRRMAKERAEEEAAMGAEAADATPKFVTAAYRAKLAEAQKWEAADRAAQEQEERQAELQRKEGGGLTSFYSNLLTKNLAFGSADAATASVSVYTAGGASQAKLLSSEDRASDLKPAPGAPEDKRKRSASPEAQHPSASSSSDSASSATRAEKALSSVHSPPSSSAVPSAASTGVTISSIPASSTSSSSSSSSSSSGAGAASQVDKEHAVAAARQRFLERKRAKVD